MSHPHPPFPVGRYRGLPGPWSLAHGPCPMGPGPWVPKNPKMSIFQKIYILAWTRTTRGLKSKKSLKTDTRWLKMTKWVFNGDIDSRQSN